MMFHSLWIVDNDGTERFSMRHDDKEILKITAESWLRCMMIRSYYINNHIEGGDN